MKRVAGSVYEITVAEWDNEKKFQDGELPSMQYRHHIAAPHDARAREWLETYAQSQGFLGSWNDSSDLWYAGTNTEGVVRGYQFERKQDLVAIVSEEQAQPLSDQQA